MNVTSQKAHTKHKWPPHATERNPPPWKFYAHATVENFLLIWQSKLVIGVESGEM